MSEEGERRIRDANTTRPYTTLHHTPLHHPTPPYTTLHHPTPDSRLPTPSSLCVLAPLHLCVPFFLFPLRPCALAPLRSLLFLPAFPRSRSPRIKPAWPRRMSFANGSHSGKG
jgi:hypothetical protein